MPFERESKSLQKFLNHKYFIFLSFLAGIILLYGRTTTYHFTDWDDPWLITQNPIVANPSAVNVYKVVFDFSLETRRTLGKEYLPIRDLSFMLDYALFGTHAGLYHLENLILYATGCYLIFLLLIRISAQRFYAWMVTWIFVLHPHHVENVAWVSERKSLLSLIFLISGLLLGMSESWKRRAGAMFFFSLAVLSKSTGIVFLPLLLMLWRKKSELRYLGLLFLQTVLHVFIAVYTGKEVGMIKTWMGDSFYSHTLTLLTFPAAYFFDLLLPIEQRMLIDVVPVYTLFDSRFLISILLMMSIGTLVYFYKNYSRYLALASLWFFVTLLPVLQIIPIPNRYAMRYLFVPSVATCLLALALFELLKSKRAKYVFSLSLIPYLFFLTVQSAALIPNWKNCQTLWEYSARFPDKQEFVQTNLFKCYKNSGELTKAKIIGQTLIEKYPHKHPILTDLGSMALDEERFDRARDYFLRAYRLHQDRDMYENNLAVTYLHEGKTKNAEVLLKKIIARNPEFKPARRNLDMLIGEPKKIR